MPYTEFSRRENEVHFEWNKVVRSHGECHFLCSYGICCFNLYNYQHFMHFLWLNVEFEIIANNMSTKKELYLSINFIIINYKKNKNIDLSVILSKLNILYRRSFTEENYCRNLRVVVYCRNKSLII